MTPTRTFQESAHIAGVIQQEHADPDDENLLMMAKLLEGTSITEPELNEVAITVTNAWLNMLARERKPIDWMRLGDLLKAALGAGVALGARHEAGL